MASLKYKSVRFINETNPFDPFNELGIKEWNRSNEEMLRDLSKAIYDMVLIGSFEQDELITWH